MEILKTRILELELKLYWRDALIQILEEMIQENKPGFLIIADKDLRKYKDDFSHKDQGTLLNYRRDSGCDMLSGECGDIRGTRGFDCSYNIRQRKQSGEQNKTKGYKGIRCHGYCEINKSSTKVVPNTVSMTTTINANTKYSVRKNAQTCPVKLTHEEKMHPTGFEVTEETKGICVQRDAVSKMPNSVVGNFVQQEKIAAQTSKDSCVCSCQENKSFAVGTNLMLKPVNKSSTYSHGYQSVTMNALPGPALSYQQQRRQARAILTTKSESIYADGNENEKLLSTDSLSRTNSVFGAVAEVAREAKCFSMHQNQTVAVKEPLLSKALSTAVQDNATNKRYEYSNTRQGHDSKTFPAGKDHLLEQATKTRLDLQYNPPECIHSVVTSCDNHTVKHSVSKNKKQSCPVPTYQQQSRPLEAIVTDQAKRVYVQTYASGNKTENVRSTKFNMDFRTPNQFLRSDIQVTPDVKCTTAHTDKTVILQEIPQSKEINFSMQMSVLGNVVKENVPRKEFENSYTSSGHKNSFLVSNNQAFELGRRISTSSYFEFVASSLTDTFLNNPSTKSTQTSPAFSYQQQMLPPEAVGAGTITTFVQTDAKGTEQGNAQCPDTDIRRSIFGCDVRVTTESKCISTQTKRTVPEKEIPQVMNKNQALEPVLEFNTSSISCSDGFVHPVTSTHSMQTRAAISQQQRICKPETTFKTETKSILLPWNENATENETAGSKGTDFRIPYSVFDNTAGKVVATNTSEDSRISLGQDKDIFVSSKSNNLQIAQVISTASQNYKCEPTHISKSLASMLTPASMKVQGSFLMREVQSNTTPRLYPYSNSVMEDINPRCNQDDATKPISNSPQTTEEKTLQSGAGILGYSIKTPISPSNSTTSVENLNGARKEEKTGGGQNLRQVNISNGMSTRIQGPSFGRVTDEEKSLQTFSTPFSRARPNQSDTAENEAVTKNQAEKATFNNLPTNHKTQNINSITKEFASRSEDDVEEKGNGINIENTLKDRDLEVSTKASGCLVSSKPEIAESKSSRKRRHDALSKQSNKCCKSFQSGDATMPIHRQSDFSSFLGILYNWPSYNTNKMSSDENLKSTKIIPITREGTFANKYVLSCTSSAQDEHSYIGRKNQELELETTICTFSQPKANGCVHVTKTTLASMLTPAEEINKSLWHNPFKNINVASSTASNATYMACPPVSLEPNALQPDAIVTTDIKCSSVQTHGHAAGKGTRQSQASDIWTPNPVIGNALLYPTETKSTFVQSDTTVSEKGLAENHERDTRMPSLKISSDIRVFTDTKVMCGQTDSSVFETGNAVGQGSHFRMSSSVFDNTPRISTETKISPVHINSIVTTKENVRIPEKDIKKQSPVLGSGVEDITEKEHMGLCISSGQDKNNLIANKSPVLRPPETNFDVSGMDNLEVDLYGSNILSKHGEMGHVNVTASELVSKSAKTTKGGVSKEVNNTILRRENSAEEKRDHCTDTSKVRNNGSSLVKTVTDFNSANGTFEVVENRFSVGETKTAEEIVQSRGVESISGTVNLPDVFISPNPESDSVSINSWDISSSDDEKGHDVNDFKTDPQGWQTSVDNLSLVIQKSSAKWQDSSVDRNSEVCKELLQNKYSDFLKTEFPEENNTRRTETRRDCELNRINSHPLEQIKTVSTICGSDRYSLQETKEKDEGVIQEGKHEEFINLPGFADSCNSDTGSDVSFNLSDLLLPGSENSFLDNTVCSTNQQMGKENGTLSFVFPMIQRNNLHQELSYYGTQNNVRVDGSTNKASSKGTKSTNAKKLSEVFIEDPGQETDDRKNSDSQISATKVDGLDFEVGELNECKAKAQKDTGQIEPNIRGGDSEIQEQRKTDDAVWCSYQKTTNKGCLTLYNMANDTADTSKDEMAKDVLTTTKKAVPVSFINESEDGVDDMKCLAVSVPFSTNNDANQNEENERFGAENRNVCKGQVPMNFLEELEETEIEADMVFTDFVNEIHKKGTRKRNNIYFND